MYQSTLLPIIYFANIIVAGWISINSIFFPKIASKYVFGNAYSTSELMRLIGCLWFSIFLLSCMAFWYSNWYYFIPVLMVQLIYKSLFILIVIVKSLQEKNYKYPSQMVWIFIVWITMIAIALL